MEMSKERPILFNTAMVKALMRGTKTQTRRIIKPQPVWVAEPSVQFKTSDCDPKGIINSPFGHRGDRLWVRETWQGPLLDEIEQNKFNENAAPFFTPQYCVYAADGGPAPEFVTLDDDFVRRWRPSIHMPRWASRITLDVIDVRIERLQDISDQDAEKEGICAITQDGWHSEDWQTTQRDAFRHLWESIYGAESWAANPLVWVAEFAKR